MTPLAANERFAKVARRYWNREFESLLPLHSTKKRSVMSPGAFLCPNMLGPENWKRCPNVFGEEIRTDGSFFRRDQPSASGSEKREQTEKH